jgi:phosphoglycerate kinase
VSDLPQLDDLEVSKQRVLVRCDLNVPLEKGRITDDLRIRASIPTLNALLERGARVAVCSHLGRPQGKPVEELRLAPVARRLAELLDKDATAVTDVAGEKAAAACKSEDSIVVLENLRFDPGEEANDPQFTDQLASLASAYVNDAFGSSHRAHASVVGVAERLPSAAGLLLEREVEVLDRLLHDPPRPFVAVLGGAKVSDKLGVIDNLLARVDSICVGGAMAFTLLAARGEDVGGSRVEKERLHEVGEVLARAEKKGVDILLPSDVVAADAPEQSAPHATVNLSDIGPRLGVDIGPLSAEMFARAIGAARTVLWNGPMGIFEIDDFSQGTKSVAEAIAGATKEGAFTVVGGGDSAAALNEMGMTDAVSHVSTGGGATLEFLEGKDLPGIAALRAGPKSHLDSGARNAR